MWEVHLPGRRLRRQAGRLSTARPLPRSCLPEPPSQVVIIKGTVEKLVGDAPQAWSYDTQLIRIGLKIRDIRVCQGGLCIVRVLQRGDCEAMQKGHQGVFGL